MLRHSVRVQSTARKAFQLIQRDVLADLLDNHSRDVNCLEGAKHRPHANLPQMGERPEVLSLTTPPRSRPCADRCLQ